MNKKIAKFYPKKNVLIKYQFIKYLILFLILFCEVDYIHFDISSRVLNST